MDLTNETTENLLSELFKRIGGKDLEPKLDLVLDSIKNLETNIDSLITKIEEAPLYKITATIEEAVDPFKDVVKFEWTANNPNISNFDLIGYVFLEDRGELKYPLYRVTFVDGLNRLYTQVGDYVYVNRGRNILDNPITTLVSWTKEQVLKDNVDGFTGSEGLESFPFAAELYV